jgi:hypothetical protein
MVLPSPETLPEMSKTSKPLDSVLEYAQVTLLVNVELESTPFGTPLVPLPVIVNFPPLLNTAVVARLPDNSEAVVKVRVPKSPRTGPFPPSPQPPRAKSQ